MNWLELTRRNKCRPDDALMEKKVLQIMTPKGLVEAEGAYNRWWVIAPWTPGEIFDGTEGEVKRYMEKRIGEI